MRYDHNAGLCYDTGCNRPVSPPDIQWMATDDGSHAVPMHRVCAAGPWPLYPVDPPPVTLALHPDVFNLVTKGLDTGS